jgi:acyl-CoA thioesterase-2
MSLALDSLVDLLDLEAIEVNIFRGKTATEERQRTFGGQVAAQALMAAGRTVDHGRVHSLHSYFLRPGDPKSPILYEVDRIRDGRSFVTRRVVAIQHGQAIYNMQSSFHDDEVSFEHQVAMPDVAPPESLSSVRLRLQTERGYVEDTDPLHYPLEQRYVGPAPWDPAHSREPRERVWIRADGELPDVPLLHACVVTYASDMNPFDAMLAPHDVPRGTDAFMGASLDHCMWFHHELRADEWLLYDMESPIAHGGRSLARGFLFSRDGVLKVSVVQEGLTRRLTPAPHTSATPSS